MIGRAWNVARQELRGFFDHPTAYVLIVAFLGLSLFLAFRSLYAAGVGSLRPFFGLLPWLFAVFVPAITMRSLAEEKRTGTLEWLLAHPLGEGELVAGKFLGNWLFVGVAVVATVPTAIGVLMASDADPGVVIAQYTGAALLAALLVSVGLWASSITRNQITAFIVAASVAFVLVLIGMPVVSIGLPPLISGALARLSVLGHFENVARGVIDLRDVLYFVSGTGLFLFLTYGAVSRQRLSSARGAYHRLRLGTGVIAAAVVVLNLLGGYVRGRLDLTAERLYTLSEGTREIVSGIEDIVTVKLFVSRELPPEIGLIVRDVRDLLADFRRASDGSLVVEELNPDNDEDVRSEASSLGISPIEFNVLRDDEFQVRRGYFGLAILYADSREVMPFIDRTDDLEFRLASSIYGMSHPDKPTLAFVTGFGARSPFQFQTFQQALSEQYDVRSVDLQNDSTAVLPADSFRIVVVAAPTEELAPNAVARVREYLDGGGSALFLLDRTAIDAQMPTSRSITTGLEPVLEERGVRVEEGIVYDLQSAERISMGRQGIFQLVQSYPLWPITFRGEDHPTTRDLGNLTAGWASPLVVTDSATVTPLWQTTSAGGIQPAGSPITPELPVPEDASLLDVRTIAAAIEPSAAAGEIDEEAPNPRIVVVGDANFLEDEFVRANPQNLAFGANAVDWLAQDEVLIGIRSKDRRPPPLVFESDFGQAALKWGNLLGVPLLFVAFGAARVLGRRRRAEKRWQEVTS
jgi:ABC-2 type transport system permease protein